MQKDLLQSLQYEISKRLFLSGAASRIVGSVPPEIGAKTNTEGVEQLDKLFVPTINRKNIDGREENVLSLAVITEGPNKGRSFGYTRLGEIDEQGFLHVFPGIPEDEAWEVFYESLSLGKLRDGDEQNPPLLPNLEYSLLGINNPYTAIQRADNQRPALGEF